MSTALIVDGQNLFMRALFAAKTSAMSHDGIFTGPMVIFANTLAKHVREEQPNRLMIMWDGGTSVQRQERLASYKATRKAVPQDEEIFRDSAFDLVLQFCAHTGVPSTRLRGVEADDLIAGAWSNPQLAVDKIVILSSDKDFMQLIGKNPSGVETEQVRLSSAGTKTDRWSYTRFAYEFGYEPAYWPLVTALAGDKGDGVPGVPGIGPVKARKLLEVHGWDWESTVQSLPSEHREAARASRFCVDLRHPPTLIPVPVPSWRPTGMRDPLWPSLIEFLSAHQLVSIKDRMHRRDYWEEVTQSDRGADVGLW